MDWISVVSSTIEALAYSESSSTLYIKFNNGSEYEYYNVPMSVYEDFLNADSKGRFGHANIYKHYQQSKR
jgi:hypothetical protein